MTRSLLQKLGLPLLCLALAVPLGFAGDETEETPEVRYGNRVSVFGGTLHVGADEIRQGDVICIGCSGVEIEGEVRGQVVVVFGSLDMDGGEARRGVVGVLADLDLARSRIGDQLVNVLGTLHQDDCDVTGQTVNIGLGDWLPGFGLWGGSIFELLFWKRLLGLLGAFVTLLILVTLVPDRVRAMADEAPVRYAPAFFVGLLAYALYPLVLILLAFTVVGAPVWYIGFKVLKWMGGAALLYLLGRRLGRVAGREMSLLGGLLLGFAIYAVLSLVPLLLGVIGAILGMVLSAFLFLFVQVPAIGLVILTRAGGRTTAAAAPPAAADPLAVPTAPPPRPSEPSSGP